MAAGSHLSLCGGWLGVGLSRPALLIHGGRWWGGVLLVLSPGLGTEDARPSRGSGRTLEAVFIHRLKAKRAVPGTGCRITRGCSVSAKSVLPGRVALSFEKRRSVPTVIHSFWATRIPPSPPVTFRNLCHVPSLVPPPPRSPSDDLGVNQVSTRKNILVGQEPRKEPGPELPPSHLPGAPLSAALGSRAEAGSGHHGGRQALEALR